MADKRTTADAAVAQLADGMTIGIGGWGSRRKPMALVRALLRSPLRDLTVVSFAVLTFTRLESWWVMVAAAAIGLGSKLLG